MRSAMKTDECRQPTTSSMCIWSHLNHFDSAFLSVSILWLKKFENLWHSDLTNWSRLVKFALHHRKTVEFVPKERNLVVVVVVQKKNKLYMKWVREKRQKRSFFIVGYKRSYKYLMRWFSRAALYWDANFIVVLTYGRCIYN